MSERSPLEDPVVEEVRKARSELWAKLDNDVTKMMAHLKTTEDDLKSRGFVFREPRKPRGK